MIMTFRRWYRCLFLISQSHRIWDVLSLTFAPYLSFSSQLYSKTLHKLYTICFWNHSVSPISLLYIHMYLLYKCTPCVYFFIYVSNVSYFLGVNVTIVPQWQHQKNVFVVCSPLPDTIRGHAVYYRQWHFYF